MQWTKIYKNLKHAWVISIVFPAVTCQAIISLGNLEIRLCGSLLYILHTWCLYCSGSNILLSTYRDKEDALNYIAAGGLCYSRLNVNPPIISCASIILDWFTLLMMALFLGLSPVFIYSLITYGMRKWRLGLTGTRLIVGKWASPYLSLLHGTCDIFQQVLISVFNV